MVKVIWRGEDTETHAGPSFNIWNGVRFPKDVAVEVSDPYMLGKLAKLGDNPFYKVIEEKQENSHGESRTQSEDKEAKDYDCRKAEKGSGYSPVKKRVRKKKAPPQDTADPTAA